MLTHEGVRDMQGYALACIDVPERYINMLYAHALEEEHKEGVKVSRDNTFQENVSIFIYWSTAIVKLIIYSSSINIRIPKPWRTFP